jgi:hypothetical protein
MDILRCTFMAKRVVAKIPTTPAVAIVALASLGATTPIRLLIVVIASSKAKPLSLSWTF